MFLAVSDLGSLVCNFFISLVPESNIHWIDVSGPKTFTQHYLNKRCHHLIHAIELVIWYISYKCVSDSHVSCTEQTTRVQTDWSNNFFQISNKTKMKC